MHLIITHEQADFDAFASLLGARLLDPQSEALLPVRLNRNVRAFLTLYGDQLALLESIDLKRRTIDQVTLVDTTHLPSLKGIGEHTTVHVVDHHPADDTIDPGWHVHQDQVGATTTLLVEAMQEVGIEPDAMTATAMLLGIYEDTGSLAYPGTTPRDVRASAWLLENGANLSIAAEFLDHPLSPAQRAVYEDLLSSAETVDIHGLSVVVSSAVADELVDEISSLAHKLRDVFDPAALFVLVGLKDNVQLVARSSSDNLDVGLLAEEFGGGGHARAAAALIRGQDLETVRRRLLARLPERVRPLKTVGEIMSRGPQLLAPGSTISQAAEMMRRFGHEGYPVVADGEVLGLLTRRAVDRAMSHKMGQEDVVSVMKTGSLVVHPQDSVEHLQQLMIAQDWGQVPVVDPQTGEIIGIVTRTDLLSTLVDPPLKRPAPQMARELERALAPARLGLLKLVISQAELHRDALFVVGGFVRDLLLKQHSHDFDLVVEGDAVRLALELASRFGGKVSSHRRFGTAKWRLDRNNPELIQALGGGDLQSLPETLDFVRARTEFYTHPTSLPSVRSGSIKLDLHRRDFTINALALRLDGRHYGQLLDPWGGGDDLEQGVIRVLHSLSFIDDPTRALRAIRLEQRLGFTIETRTHELLLQALPLLDRVSGERIRHEFDLALRETEVIPIFRRMDQLGLLRSIHADLEWDDWLESRFERSLKFSPPIDWRLKESPSAELYLYALMVLHWNEDQGRAFCERLKLPILMRRAILQAGIIGRQLPELARRSVPSEVVALLGDKDETALAIAWLALADDRITRLAIDGYLRSQRFVTPGIDGHHLQALGLRPGPDYSRLLKRIHAAWLDGEVRTAEEERDLLSRLVAELEDRRA